MKKEYFIDPFVLPRKDKTFSFKKAFKYAKLMERGVEFPPVNVYVCRNGNHLTFNDGRHRVAAAKMAGVRLKVKRTV